MKRKGLTFLQKSTVHVHLNSYLVQFRTIVRIDPRTSLLVTVHHTNAAIKLKGKKKC